MTEQMDLDNLVSEAVRTYMSSNGEGLLALGGFLSRYGPRAITAHLLRLEDARRLNVLSTASGYTTDVLLAGGLVSTLSTMFVSLEQHGLAPGFRTAAESGQLTVREYDGPSIFGALRAGLLDLPYFLIPDVMNDVSTLNPAAFTFDVPLPAGYLAVRPLKPKVCFLHACYADSAGNLYYKESVGADFILASASEAVYATVEEVRAVVDPADDVIPAFLVDAFAVEPFGAIPNEVPGYYKRDDELLGSYLSHCETFRRSGQLVASPADREALFDNRRIAIAAHLARLGQS